jgi:hypothetical protein
MLAESFLQLMEKNAPLMIELFDEKLQINE